MPKRKKKKTVMIRIDLDVKEELKLEAYKKGITLTQYLRNIIKNRQYGKTNNT